MLYQDKNHGFKPVSIYTSHFKGSILILTLSWQSRTTAMPLTIFPQVSSTVLLSNTNLSYQMPRYLGKNISVGIWTRVKTWLSNRLQVSPGL